MNEKKAKEILKNVIMEENILSGSLGSEGSGITYYPGGVVILDGIFTPDDLKAIVWWMENWKK